MRRLRGWCRQVVFVVAATGLLLQARAQYVPAVVDLPTRPGVTQRVLVQAPRDTPRAVVLLFAGGHGGLRIAADGSLGWGKGNFLVRSRQRFVDHGLLVVTLDAPSDRQAPPYLLGFRQTPDHASDVAAVIAWVRQRHAGVPVWLVGTSRGTQSAAYLATELQGERGPDGVVLSASVLVDRKDRPLPAMPLARIRVPVLVVHHEQDGCRACPFADVPALLERLSNAPRRELLAFTGGVSEGDPCEAFAHHGFNGIEADVVRRVSTGRGPPFRVGQAVSSGRWSVEIIIPQQRLLKDSATMPTSPDIQPGLVRRVLGSPPARVLLLGFILLLLMGLNGDVMTSYAEVPVKAVQHVIAMVIAGFAVYVGHAHFIERRAVHELALPGMGRELGIGLLIGAGLYTACELVLMALGIYRIDGLNPLSYLIPAIAMALSSSVFEELLFRGVLFGSVEAWFGSWAALVVSSLVFGLTHLINPQGTIEGALFIAVEAGILLGAAFMLTRRLWLSIGFHMAWNYTQSAIFSGIVSGNDAAPGLIRSTVKGPDFLTGGSFGVESSVLALTLCTMTGIVMLVLAARRRKVVPPIWKRSA
jgi:membrane protease YdiL (CAAX protease family)/pimeloyl-ACP methyl ester carboxylesterase